MRLWALRGAHSVESNEAGAISAAVRELCAELLAKNGIGPAELISAIFTLTPDLDAAFPAAAAREVGWSDVPMLCAREIAVPGAPPSIVRILAHAHLPDGRQPQHVYLGRARVLRPDLAHG